MKILVTGAHFTPAVATIEELKKFKDIEIVYVGRKTTQEGDNTLSVESKVLPSLGVKFIPIITGRLQRSFTFYTVPSLLKVPIGILQSLYIILSEKPDVVLSFGGYVAVPCVLVAWLFSIPIIIHEQTLVSGLANKISSLFADKIAVSFDKNEFKGEKVILTGNPIRQEVMEKRQSVKLVQNKKPLVLIVGGNQGSHILNLVVEQSLDKLTKIASIIHQTGDSKFKDFERLKSKENEFYRVEKFINEDWGEIIGKCDLVITRAGINTLTEISYLQKPALVIPIKGHHEQNTNARYFEKLGLVKILPQSQLSSASLFNGVKDILADLNNLKEKIKGVKKVIIADAAKRLALATVLLGKIEK